jgi:hypothetical protein
LRSMLAVLFDMPETPTIKLHNGWTPSKSRIAALNLQSRHWKNALNVKKVLKSWQHCFGDRDFIIIDNLWDTSRACGNACMDDWALFTLEFWSELTIMVSIIACRFGHVGPKPFKLGTTIRNTLEKWHNQERVFVKSLLVKLVKVGFNLTVK